jgi:hypothetical protein
MWSIINFGRHEGKSLPQILLSDPDWFFWAMDSGVFENRPNLLPEATRLAVMAKHIKIPRPNPEKWQIRYLISHDGKFQTFEIVEAGPEYLDPMHVVLDDHLDLSFPRSLKTYDKLGYKLFLRAFRYYFLGSERAPLTKKRCEEFFEDRSNFLEQGPSIVPEPITQSETASA